MSSTAKILFLRWHIGCSHTSRVGTMGCAGDGGIWGCWMIPPHHRKLTRQWTITIMKRGWYIFKWSFVYCHLHFCECKCDECCWSGCHLHDLCDFVMKIRTVIMMTLSEKWKQMTKWRCCWSLGKHYSITMTIFCLPGSKALTNKLDVFWIY